MPAGGAVWELRASVAVLYTHQKAVKRPVFREGSLRIACGRAALLDATGRELDEETLSGPLLEQLRAGEEIDFPGHLVRPEAPLEPLAGAPAPPAPVPAPQPAPGSPRVPQRPHGGPDREGGEAPPSEKKVRQPFKRPRLLLRSVEPPAPPPCSPCASSSAAPAPAPPGPRAAAPPQAPREPPAVCAPRPPLRAPDLWEECAEEDRLAGEEEETALGGSHACLNLWAQCTAEDAAHRKAHGPDDPCRNPAMEALRDKQHGRAPMVAKLAEQDPGSPAGGFDCMGGALQGAVPAACEAQEASQARVGPPAVPEAAQAALGPVQPPPVPSRGAVMQQPQCGGVTPPRSHSPRLTTSLPAGAAPASPGQLGPAVACTPLGQPQPPGADAAQACEWSQHDQELEDPITSTPTQPPALAVWQAAQGGRGATDSEDELLRAVALPGAAAAPAAPAAPFGGGGAGLRRGPPARAIDVPFDSEDELPQAAPLGPGPAGAAAGGAEDEEGGGGADSDDAPLAALVNPGEGGEEEEEEDPIKPGRRPGKAEAKRGARKAPKRQGEEEAAGEGDRQQSARRRSGAKESAAVAPAPLPLRFMECTPPMGDPKPPSFPSREAYARHFIGALMCEMQGRLSEIAAAWHAFEGGAPAAFPHEVAAVARNVLMGPSPGAPRTAALIFSPRTRVVSGDLRFCSRGDLWILMPPGHEPLLMRSLWRGISPKGRLLCTAANDAAVAWLEEQEMRGSGRLVPVTGLASGAFAAELTHADNLHAYSEGGDCVYTEECGESAPRQHFKDDALDRVLGIGSAARRAAAAPGPEAPLPLDVAESPELAVLSAEQAAVVRTAGKWVLDGAKDRCTMLVRGVFGSGKSRTLAACIVMLDRLLSARKDPRRILLVCQTNVAVDAVLMSLLKRQGWDNFARLGSFRGVDPTLLYRTVSLSKTRQSAVKELTEALQRRPPDIQASLKSAVDRGVLPPKMVVWRRHRLLAATTAALDAAEHFGADALRCPIVLVDEATQLTEPAVFGCLRRVGAQQLLVVGDPRQLPPRAEHAALRCSLLERLWEQQPGAFRAELATQFRCHPAIAELGSALFYGGWLRSGVSAVERGSVLGAGGPPLAVILSDGAEARAGQSYKHEYEARFCVAWLRRALGCGQLQPQDVGVICLYRAQAEACTRALAAAGLRGVQAATVDAFQGGERELTILSCGRSTVAAPRDTFANCPRRLNVALSRARRHLVVLGGETFLAAHPHLSRVMAAAQGQGALHFARNVLAA